MRLPRLCCVSVAIVVSTLSAAPPSPPQSAAVLTDEHRRLFEQLDGDDFALRQRAGQILYEGGIASIPALETAALGGQAGIRISVLRVLERMFIEGFPDVADAAERALERLAFSDVPETMTRARAVLSGNHQLRQRRAVAAIRELGGRVEFMPLEGSPRGNLMWGWGGDPPFVIPGQPLVWIHVFLLRGWQGGEEGLWHLTRLEDAWSARLWGLDITNVRGSGLPMETVQALAARIPHLQVDERGASLGITGSGNGFCEVKEVLDGGAAHAAGLRTGDLVVQLDEIPIDDFGDLISNLLNYEPEEAATLKIKRAGANGQLMELEIPVVLGGWENVNIASRNRMPTPLMPPFNNR